jgi:hypothetical protein
MGGLRISRRAIHEHFCSIDKPNSQQITSTPQEADLVIMYMPLQLVLEPKPDRTCSARDTSIVCAACKAINGIGDRLVASMVRLDVPG